MPLCSLDERVLEIAMLDHVTIGVTDIERSQAFYDQAFILDPDGHNIEAVCHQPGD